MYPSATLSSAPATEVILRVVLLDQPAEHSWAPNAVRMSDAPQRLTALIDAPEVRRHAVGWAASALGVSEAEVANLSAPLRPEFLARLLKSVDRAFETAAVLCAEILGWQERRLTDPIERWVALAALVPSDFLDRWIVDGRDDLSAALRLGDRLAEAGVPVGLRLTPVAWQQFLASPAWDRAATRWRQARTMGGQALPEVDAEPAASHRFLAAEAPAVLPMLAAAQAALRPQAATDLREARSAAEALLFAVLEERPPTRGRFRLNVALDFSFGGRPAEGDLVASAPRVVVEVDGYHHFQQAERYRRDRRKDVLLQQHGWLVMRCLAEDAVLDLERIVHEIEAVLARRDAVQNSH